jgi:hypothetical protein
MVTVVILFFLLAGCCFALGKRRKTTALLHGFNCK